MNGDFEELKSRCLELCNSAITEIQREVLFVETKTISKREDVSNKATVGLILRLEVMNVMVVERQLRHMVFLSELKLEKMICVFAAGNIDEWDNCGQHCCWWTSL
jgi:hypothetical protein